ncbi:hypothetical protein QBC42DRAFT_292225, partial [Cladorrhinum samala]
MYSARHHLTCSIISCTAAAAYKAAAGVMLQVLPEAFLPLQLAVFVSWAAYTIKIIWKGPCSQPHRSPTLQSAAYVVSTWLLLFSLGGLVEHAVQTDLSLGDMTWIRPVLHVLLALNVLGLVEPIRQNRRAVEPFSGAMTAMLYRTGGQRPVAEVSSPLVLIYAVYFMHAVRQGLFFLVDPIIRRFSGPRACAEIILDQASERNGLFGFCLILIGNLAIFDLTDT